jgi:L-rhamnonate dehydratase
MLLDVLELGSCVAGEEQERRGDIIATQRREADSRCLSGDESMCSGRLKDAFLTVEVALLEPFHLRWLEEAVIPDDTRGYKELKSYGRVPIAGGEHEFTIFGFRELLESNVLDYIQFDTNRVGGISQARKISALAEAFQVPVVPHAGQMHNYHVVMASLNSPIAEFFPKVDVEVGNELFWYIFDGEPTPANGYINLVDNVPGLGLTVNEESLKRFRIVE